MPRVAKTNEEGMAEFITDAVPLPVTDVLSSLSVLEALTKQNNLLALIAARLEEAYQTGINEGDV